MITRHFSIYNQILMLKDFLSYVNNASNIDEYMYLREYASERFGDINELDDMEIKLFIKENLRMKISSLYTKYDESIEEENNDENELETQYPF